MFKINVFWINTTAATEYNLFPETQPGKFITIFKIKGIEQRITPRSDTMNATIPEAVALF